MRWLLRPALLVLVLVLTTETVVRLGSVPVLTGPAGPIAPGVQSPPLALVSLETVTVTARPVGMSHAGTLTLAARGGDITLRTENGYQVLGPGHPGCAGTQATWQCRTAVRWNSSHGTTLQALSPVSLETVDIRHRQARPIANIVPTHLATLVLVLGLIAGVFAWRGTPPHTRAAGLAGLTALWAVWAAGPSGLLLLALVGALAIPLWSLLRAPGSRLAMLGVAGTVFLLLLLFKARALNGLALFATVGTDALPLPLGFAFFVLRAVDLTLRISTREVSTLSWPRYVSYMLFPPVLMAGPMQGLPDFEQHAAARVSATDWTVGFARLLMGVSKKLLAELLAVALLAPRMDRLLADPTSLAPATLWVVLLATMVYVYLDFSGYSDLAIGSARQLGWTLPENFNWPFAQRNMRAFWAAWHISLSRWVSAWVHALVAFRLRRAPHALRTAAPVVATLVVIGLWHEPQWVWMLWGLHHAAGILVGDALGRGRSMPRWWGTVGIWGWVALSHCFTVVSDPTTAVRLWMRAISWGWWNP